MRVVYASIVWGVVGEVWKREGGGMWLLTSIPRIAERRMKENGFVCW